MAIKDILQSLVDDAMVDTDKVGSANYFWAFPSKAASAVGHLLVTLAHVIVDFLLILNCFHPAEAEDL
jgi:hypothetical protein